MSFVAKTVKALKEYGVSVFNMGAVNAVLYKVQKLRSRSHLKGSHLTLRTKAARFPVEFRAHTSDVDAFSQIFVEREYQCLDDLLSAQLIIDCGANVGYSSVYFLSRFPDAFVIAVEPDPGNFAMIERNLAPFAGRFKAVNSAIWSHPTGLVFSTEKFGDGREWSRIVREAKPGETPHLMAVSIGQLFKDSGYARLSVLKIDIEGSEKQVFSSPEYREWLPKVDSLVIELHGSDCRDTFTKAVLPEGFTLSRSGELTVCRRKP